MNMIQELVPPPQLAQHVDAFWSSDGGESSRVLPDGCADVIFELDAARVIAVGTMTKPLLVEDARRQLGVRFRPGYAALFFGAPLAEYTDQCVPLRDLGMLAARVSEAGSIEQQWTVIRNALAAAQARDAMPDRRVVRAIDLISGSGGRRRIEDICDDIGVSRQHLARLFNHHVGIKPKTFARVARFRRALRLARTHRWSELASELGYFDQSHLIAEFQEFADDTPVPFFLSR